MSSEPSIFQQDEEADALRHAEALADIAAGRLFPNDDVCAWLETWGTPDEKPAPASWFEVHGLSLRAERDALDWIEAVSEFDEPHRDSPSPS